MLRERAVEGLEWKPPAARSVRCGVILEEQKKIAPGEG